MSKVKVAGNPEFDPTMPSVNVRLKGKVYHLAFTFGALAIAEAKARSLGLKVNLLAGLDFRDIDAGTLTAFFYAALQPAHPDVSFEQARDLITPKNAAAVFGAVCSAYMESIKQDSGDDGPAENPQ